MRNAKRRDIDAFQSSLNLLLADCPSQDVPSTITSCAARCRGAESSVQQE